MYFGMYVMTEHEIILMNSMSFLASSLQNEDDINDRSIL